MQKRVVDFLDGCLFAPYTDGIIIPAGAFPAQSTILPLVTILDVSGKLSRKEGILLDQREIKTKRAIKNAFLILRAQKPIEKITIRELAALAEISKATFYLHYQDIYDLSEQIGKEVLTNILNSISRPENVLEKPDVFTREITTGFFSQINLIQLLFSGSQAHILPDLVDSSIREYIYRLKPEYTDNMQFNIRLSMLIKGSFYAFYDNYHKYDNAALIDEICAFLGQCTR